MKNLVIFDPDIAKRVGIPAAAVYRHMEDWIREASKTGGNCFGGMYWLRCSIKDLSRRAPYLSRKQFAHAIDDLVRAGLVIKNNFNADPLDRTYWYAIPNFNFTKTDEATK